MQVGREGVPQRLPFLTEAGFGQFKEIVHLFGRDQGLVIKFNADDGRIDLGLRIKSGSRDDHRDVCLSVDLDAERQQAQLSGGGADPFRDLFLDGQRQLLRTGFPFQQMADDGRGDVVRNVCGDVVFFVFEIFIRGKFQDIPFNDLNIGTVRQFFPQDGDQVFVQFDGNDALRTRREVACQVCSFCRA